MADRMLLKSLVALTRGAFSTDMTYSGKDTIGALGKSNSKLIS